MGYDIDENGTKLNIAHQETVRGDRPTVYAVVLNYNGAEDTVKCVRSLQQSGYTNLSIVIVDNASPDGSGDILAAAFPELPLLRERSNTGYAGGNNAGIRYALKNKADFVLIINNDVEVERGFLEPMVAILDRDAEIGVVSPKVFYTSAPTEIFSAAGEFSRLYCTGLNTNRKEEVLKSTTLECDVDYVCGVLLLVRSALFANVGLLDERFFMYFEDLEFSHRVLTRYRMVYTARAIAYHKSGGGKGWKSYTELYLYYHTRNRLWVFQDESLLFRTYVTLFTLANSLAKAAAALLNWSSDRRKAVGQWAALCRGFVDGIRGYDSRTAQQVSNPPNQTQLQHKSMT